MLDTRGRIVGRNRAARRLTAASPTTGLPPSWLADAHRRHVAGTSDPTAATPAGTFGDRAYEARPSPTGDGAVAWWLFDRTDLERAETAARETLKRADATSDLFSTLLSSLNVPRCAEVAARMAADHLAEAAVLITPPVGHRYAVTHALRGRRVVQETRQIDPRSVPGLDEALRGFPPVPARWINPAAIPDWVIPEGFSGPPGSVLVTPLPGHGVPAGALILLRSDTEKGFTTEEEGFARLFASRAGTALSAARLYSEQTAITGTLMRELLPPPLSRVHGVDYAGRYRTAMDHERVGGDFYDVHPGPDASAETFVALGDVAGKGLDAAVLTGKIRNTLHALLPLASDHLRVLRMLNGALLTSHHARFATLVLASVKRQEGSVRLRLTSAGHLPPLVVRADGRVEEVPTQGTLVGALPKVTAKTVQTVLAPGDICLLYTDGITEARGGPLGGELFGEERLRQALAGCGGMPGEAMVEHVQMLAAQWLEPGSRHDDMAVVAIGAPRAGHATDDDEATGADARPRRNG
ncbi:SpoIIE family protein phosphatase [Streptomyces sp. RO-S4]|uniref:PP2C family protein-serine/threonine phosphatase n=1 Tax=unclassified Streptomyces TaxID=2593676 RepID=UPI00208E3D84|nr:MULTISPECIES: SpoIIE family protein phosphatase [unclassified Streptomyces]MCO4697078.1 SpoIIE family protein phosphatase [Streptomyces sp. RO-S4]MDU0304515.1 SpoIIE family protein phosphatase [Streptomyces sp. PAL114]